jgi:putative peptidoglycan lipid II flippase
VTAAASSRRTIATAGLIVTGAFFASRVLGWFRLAVISTTFGASGQLDAFFAAFRIPDLIFQLVAAGALSSALIPVVAGLLATDQDARAWRVASTVTNLMLGALLVLAVVFAIGAPWIVPLITPGFDVVQTEITVELTRIMLISPILLALGAVATSILNARGRFAAAASAPIVYNVAIILGAVLFAPSLGVYSLALGVIVGSLGNLVVQLRPLWATGFRYEPIVEVADPEARQALLLMAPRAVGLGVTQLTFIVSTTLASGLATGSITAFNVAFTVLQIPIGLIGVPLGVVVFPSLARELAVGAVTQYVALLTRSVRLILFVMLPITGLAMVLRRQVVTLLFDYGRFDQAAIDLTSEALLYFLIGLAAHSLIAILARAFYAAKDTKTPVIAAILAVVVNVSFGIATVGTLGLAGLALGIALGAWFEALFLLLVLHGRIEGFDLGPLARVFAESSVASLAAALVALGSVRVIDGLIGADPGKLALLAEAVVAASAGGLAFIGLALLLRIPELTTIVEVMGDLIRRPRRS